MDFLENIKNLSGIQWAFYLLSGLALFGAIGTISSKNAMHSVIYLILTFFALSGHYILLNAQFLAVVNIIVYAGAIMVLFLFVIMLLNLDSEEKGFIKNSTLIASSIVGGTIGVLLIASFKLTTLPPIDPTTYNPSIGLTQSLGKLLYRDYLLPFELVSILFLAAMAGAVLLGKKEKLDNNL